MIVNDIPSASRRRIPPAALVGGAALIGALVGTFVAPAAPASATVALSFDLGPVQAGATAADAQQIVVPETARVADAVFAPIGGDAAWDARLCDDSGTCHALTRMRDTVIPAGTYRIAVSVTVPATALPGTSTAAAGSLTFVSTSETPSSTASSAASLADGVDAAVASARDGVASTRNRSSVADTTVPETGADASSAAAGTGLPFASASPVPDVALSMERAVSSNPDAWTLAMIGAMSAAFLSMLVIFGVRWRRGRSS